jgi:hypothetical protein
MQFSPASCYFPLRSKFFFRTLFSNTLSLSSSHNARDPSKGKFFAVDVMNSCRGIVALVIFNFTPRPFYHREKTPVPIEKEAGWAPDPVGTIWITEQFFATAWIRTLHRPVRSLQRRVCMHSEFMCGVNELRINLRKVYYDILPSVFKYFLLSLPYCTSRNSYPPVTENGSYWRRARYDSEY